MILGVMGSILFFLFCVVAEMVQRWLGIGLFAIYVALTVILGIANIAPRLAW